MNTQSNPRSEDVTILRALLEAEEGAYVSGSGLAEQLGLSRVSVRTRIQQLESEGFAVEAIRHKGYRLLAQPETLHPALLEAEIARKEFHLPVHLLHEVDSTNAEATRLLSTGAEAPFAVLANRQSAGRGRMGRTWFSEAAGNLYLSLALRPQLPPARMGPFTLWMGLKVCQFLDERHDAAVGIKWPNDLLCNGRKLAGMLTEARIDTDFTRELVFGLGLNVNSTPADWPEALSTIATSLREAIGKSFSLNAFAADLLATLVEAYEAFVSGAYAADFKVLWTRYDSLMGKDVTLHSQGSTFEGTACGINDDGSLALQRPDGSRLSVRAGDVTLRPS